MHLGIVVGWPFEHFSWLWYVLAMLLFGCNLLFRFFLLSSVVLGLGLGCMHASLVYLGLYMF